MSSSIELGLDTFGDVTVDANGQLLSQAQALRNLVDQGVMADHEAREKNVGGEVLCQVFEGLGVFRTTIFED